MYTRDIAKENYSFFLFGARGTGKSTWLETTYPDAYFIDLLSNEEYLRFTKSPGLLQKLVLARPKDQTIVIDEIQKVPELLDEVHLLMSKHKYGHLVLTGSSARKIRAKGVNMLAGRAIEKHLFPLTCHELNNSIPIDQLISFGALPLVIGTEPSKTKKAILETNVNTYLDGEIKKEALVRNLGSFSRFLEAAALCAGQTINVSGLSRDAEVSRDSTRGYFDVLEEALMIRRLPAFRPRAKVKEISSPKLYWFDSGVLNACAGYFSSTPPSDWQGVLFKHFYLSRTSMLP